MCGVHRGISFSAESYYTPSRTIYTIYYKKRNQINVPALITHAHSHTHTPHMTTEYPARVKMTSRKKNYARVCTRKLFTRTSSSSYIAHAYAHNSIAHINVVDGVCV